jgi:hypothetical protein
VEQSFLAILSGQQEVPPVQAKASGEASFELTDQGTKLRYEITVSDIQNVTMAHLHLAPEGKLRGQVH